MAILGSGARRSFATGAVRDITDGKGRCDLLPLSVVADILDSETLKDVAAFVETKDTKYIIHAILLFFNKSF